MTFWVPTHRSIAMALFALTLIVGMGSATVYARQPRLDATNLQTPLQTNQIASVDMDRLYAASGGPEQLAQQATELAMEVAQHLKEIRTASMLDQQELQEYGTLIFKTKRTDGDQARIRALKALSDQRSDELKALQTKPDTLLTDADKARMRALQEQGRLVESILPFWQEDARAQQSARIEMFRRNQIARIRAIVGKVATERNITHVFDTSALVYSANDITSLVLPKVTMQNKKP